MKNDMTVFCNMTKCGFYKYIERIGEGVCDNSYITIDKNGVCEESKKEVR